METIFEDGVDNSSDFSEDISGETEGNMSAGLSDSNKFDAEVLDSDILKTEMQTGDVVLYVDIDYLQTTLTDFCVPLISFGFAFSTLLILITYGVFKAIGFIRIKK